MEQVPTRTRTVSGVRQAGTLVTELARQVEGKATVEDGTQEKETNMEDGKEITTEDEQEGEVEDTEVGETIGTKTITHLKAGGVRTRTGPRTILRTNLEGSSQRRN